jgi:hypothetical protein
VREKRSHWNCAGRGQADPALVWTVGPESPERLIAIDTFRFSSVISYITETPSYLLTPLDLPTLSGPERPSTGKKTGRNFVSGFSSGGFRKPETTTPLTPVEQRPRLPVGASSFHCRRSRPVDHQPPSSSACRRPGFSGGRHRSPSWPARLARE